MHISEYCSATSPAYKCLVVLINADEQIMSFIPHYQKYITPMMRGAINKLFLLHIVSNSLIALLGFVVESSLGSIALMKSKIDFYEIS